MDNKVQDFIKILQQMILPIKSQTFMNMCFEWCLARAHKAQEIDPLLEKLTHLSGLKG